MSTLKPYEQILSHYDMRDNGVSHVKANNYKSFTFNHDFSGDYQFVIEFYDDGDVNIVAYLVGSESNLDFWYISYSRLDYKTEEDFISVLDKDIGRLCGNNTKIIMKKKFFSIDFCCYYYNNDNWEFFKSNSYLRFGNFSFPKKKEYVLLANS